MQAKCFYTNRQEITMVDEDYGRLEIRLAELMEEKGLNWNQVNNYCTNNISRLDTFVLCKLCTVLECDIQDLLVFIPSEKG